MNWPVGLLPVIGATIFLGLEALAGPHGHEDDAGTMVPTVSAAHIRPTVSPWSGSMDEGPRSYYGYSEHAGLIYSHIGLMIVAWMFVLPLGT